ncbi:MAG: hypothetical protein VB852_09295 [Deltaproteobacteria bacterium]
MTTTGRASAITVSVVAASLVAACGGSTLTYGGKTDDGVETVSVVGNIEQSTPLAASRDTVVFVYTDLVSLAGLLAAPQTYSDYTDGELYVVEYGDSDFTVSGLAGGALTIIFLRDGAGTNADGQIDSGDPVATLADPDGTLADVRAGQTVDIDDVEIDYNSGTATADEIELAGSAE